MEGSQADPGVKEKLEIRSATGLLSEENNVLQGQDLSLNETVLFCSDRSEPVKVLRNQMKVLTFGDTEVMLCCIIRTGSR